MKYAYLGLGFVLFGLFGLVFIVMFQSITVDNESEYYVLKEAMEAAMLESVDLACYRIGDENGYVDEDKDGVLDYEDKNGNETLDDGEQIKKACGDHDVKIVEQKFIENFTRRFATSISGDASEYTIEFYDIMEMPPKATIVVKGKTQEYELTIDSHKSSFTLTNNLSGILELYN